MLFHSLEFIFVFVPAVMLLFGLAADRAPRHVLHALLVLASLCFYAWWNWTSLAIIAVSIGFNFACGTALLRAAGRRRRAWILAAGIAANVVLLGYYKYRAFVVESLGAALGTEWSVAALALPLAISFFTFHQISYLVDIFRGHVRAQRFVTYCLFLTFFPQLIAGPILQYRHAIPILTGAGTFTLRPSAVSEGLLTFAIGLFKKVMLADHFAPLVGPVFDRPELPSFFDAWGAVLAVALQIYFDFSGYSDMAVGLGLLFNVRLPENFDSPYKAQCVIDFWRRWHMTLSAFLVNYVYIPLGGNRGSPPRQAANVMITMVLGGLWHGASWTFITWGAVHGVLLIINRIWQRTGIVLPGLLCWALTFVPIIAGFVFVRADSLGRAGTMLAAMAGGHGFAYDALPYSFGGNQWRDLAIGLVIVLGCPNRQAIMRWEWASDRRYALAFALLFTISILGLGDPIPFYYFQF